MNRGSFFKGFSLIEVVISLGILVIGILAVLSLFPLGFDSANRASDLTKATIFAQQKMEEIKRNGYPITPVAAPAVFAEDQRFTYTVTVTTGASLPSNLQQVTLMISWARRGKTYNEDFVTFIPKYNP